MKLPKSVKVGGHVLNVVPVDKKVVGYFGQHDRDLSEIQIATDVSASQQATSLLHEILHTCFAESGLRAKIGGMEEDIVAGLEGLLFATIRDNPKVIKFIQGAK